MRLLIGFDGWKAISEMCCGLLLVFSFIGGEKIGKMYGILLSADIIIIVFTMFLMTVARYLECKDLKIKNN
jgi:hypothetical protein